MGLPEGNCFIVGLRNKLEERDRCYYDGGIDNSDNIVTRKDVEVGLKNGLIRGSFGALQE